MRKQPYFQENLVKIGYYENDMSENDMVMSLLLIEIRKKGFYNKTADT